MRKTRSLIAALAIAGAFASISTVAHASPEPSGFDDKPDLIVGGGSDTTYLVHQRLEALWNAAPGCAIDTSATSATKGQCLLPASGDTKGNFDHEVAVSLTPTGSTAGVRALTSTGVQFSPNAIDYARSSRGPNNTTETAELAFWGFARDAIAVTTFGSRSGVSLTKQNLVDIYTCQTTADDWSDFGLPAGPIIPWTMNSSSGTFATFQTYLGLTAFGPCVRSLVGGTAPFENDVKPIIADAGPDGVANTADDNEDNFIWWMSFGNFKTYPFTTGAIAPGEAVRTDANLVTVDGVALNNGNVTNNTYPIGRSIFHVTRKVDATIDPACSTGPTTCASNVIGADTGKAGAVREFTEFICRNTAASHTTSVTSGRNYLLEIGSAVTREGFLAMPASLRTPGYACQVLA